MDITALERISFCHVRISGAYGGIASGVRFVLAYN
jgi:hypothetical protein